MTESCPFCSTVFEFSKNQFGDLVILNDSGCEHVRIHFGNFGFSRPSRGKWKTRHAAEHLGVTRRRVAQLIAAGLIVAEKDGRDWDIDEASVRAYADTMQVRMPMTRIKGGSK